MYLNISCSGITDILIRGDDLVSIDMDGNKKKYYISDIKTLDCSENQLASLPILPKGLKTLDCSENQITSLPILPSRLKHLDCSRNQLTSLPVLPKELKHLNCYGNQIISLPMLPRELEFLHCDKKQLISLPEEINQSAYTQYFEDGILYYFVPSNPVRAFHN